MMANYKLNRLEDTDIFFLAKENIELLGENLITGTFSQVLSLASTLKDNAVGTLGEGELIDIDNPVIELTHITNANWYLLIMSDRYQIVRTSDTDVYNLPTNILEGSGQGNLEHIFEKIIERENT